MRARDLKFYVFLINVKTNLVKYFFAIKIIFEATGLGQKKLIRAINQKKIVLTFSPFKIQEYCINILKKDTKK